MANNYPLVMRGAPVDPDAWYNLIATDLTNLSTNVSPLSNDWLTYAPSWTASGTPPTLGNGTIDGRYILTPHLLIAFFRITWGSTTAGGTGTWSVSLPAANFWVSEPAICIMRDNSSNNVYPLSCRLSSGNLATDYYTWTAAGVYAAVSGTHPVTWATSDALVGKVVIQV